MLSGDGPCTASSASANAIMGSGLRRRTHPAADFGEELPLGWRQAVDAARVDLVEHAVDLGVRPRVTLHMRLPPRPRGGARPRAWLLADQHARLRHPSLAAFRAREAPIL